MLKRDVNLASIGGSIRIMHYNCQSDFCRIVNNYAPYKPI
jgi:hypothetical protein